MLAQYDPPARVTYNYQGRCRGIRPRPRL